MDISVILSTFKRPDLLTQTLQSFCSLKTGGFRWEVLLVDNARDERTREIASKFSNRLPIKFLVETKRGKNSALNKAIPQALGKIFVFTDDDIIADPRWLIELREGIKRWPDYYVFGGRILPKWPDGQGKFLDNAFCRTAYAIADWDIPEGCYSAAKVWGPNMAIRASIFRDGWRFNPNLGPDGTDNYLTGSESELVIQLKKAGFGAVYMPQSLVFHQIRPEQMELSWLYRRAFRAGRLTAYTASRPNVPMICGIPQGLIRPVCKEFIMFAVSALSRDKNRKAERGVSYWYRRGMIYQFRNQPLRNSS